MVSGSCIVSIVFSEDTRENRRPKGDLTVNERASAEICERPGLWFGQLSYKLAFRLAE